MTTWGISADATGSYSVHLYGCGAYVPGATCNVDADGDGVVDVNDAQFVLRRLLGFSGDAIIGGATFRQCATRKTGADIATFVSAQSLPIGGAIRSEEHTSELSHPRLSRMPSSA